MEKNKIKEYMKKYLKKWKKENPQKVKEYYIRHREKMKEYLVYYYIKNIDKIKKDSSDWKKNNKDSLKSWRLKNIKKLKTRKLALKIQIPKNQLCEICNKNLATERHHEDYNKPLKIIFLCKLCHIYLHKKRRIVV